MQIHKFFYMLGISYFILSILEHIWTVIFYLLKAEMKLVNNASVLKQHYEKKLNELEHEKKFLQVNQYMRNVFCGIIIIIVLTQITFLNYW